MQRLGLFSSSYLERLKEGDTAMLVLSTLGGTGGGGGGSGNSGFGGLGGFGSPTNSGSGNMNLRARSTRASRRNLREWSSDSDNDFGGGDDDFESAFETEQSSMKHGSDNDGSGDKANAQDPMSGIGLQPTYLSLPKRARRRTAHQHLRDNQAAWLAQQEESLVPIRLELEVGDYRLHDVFVWNAKEQVITPEQFAAVYCADLSLPQGGRVGAQEHIAQLIQQQVAEHISANDCAYRGSELRVNLNIEVQVGPHVLRDRVEWDILEPLGSRPEEFARCLCRDLGLGGEYPPLVAHRVREEVARMHKELSEAGDAHWLRQNPVDSIFRPINMAEAWGPSIEIMSAEDLDRMWMHKERSYRRMRRSERSSHTRSFNFLPPESVPVESAAAVSSLELPDISSAFYNQLSLSGGASGGGGSSTGGIDGGLSSGATTPQPPMRKAHSSVRVPGTPTRSSTPTRPSTPRNYSKLDLSTWECQHCGCASSVTPIQRQGPNGPKTLCNACGIAWMVRNRQELPSHRKDLFRK